MSHIGADPFSDQGTAISIQDVARTVRKARHYAQLDYGQAQELLRLQSGNELLVRLCRSMQETSTVLIDYMIGESHKREFCESYTSIMNQADSVLEHVESRDKQLTLGFTNKVSLRSRRSLLVFLHRTRTDHSWVAERLSSLTASELESIVPHVESLQKQSSSLREAPREEDDVHKLQRTAPLNSFLFKIFAPVGAFAVEDRLRLDLTATILCRLIRDNKLSSKGDKLCLSAMDAWSSLYGWEASKSFELLLMDTLQSGVKIIERAEARNLVHPPQHRAYYFSQPKRDEVEEEFFSVAARNLFKLLSNTDFGALPQGALMLSKAVLDKVPDNDRRHYEAFMIINWFFYRFLSRAITHPEQLGLLNDYYISEAKRHRILFVLQQKVYSYCVPTPKAHSYKRNSLDEEIEGYVLSIFAKFRASAQDPSNLMVQTIGENSMVTRKMRNFSEQEASPSIFLCAADIFTMFSTLCPPTRSSSPDMVSAGLSRHRSTGSVGSNRSSSFKPARSSKIMFDIGSSFRDDDTTSEATTDVDDALSPRRAGSGNAFLPIFETRTDDAYVEDLRMAVRDLSQNCDVAARTEAIIDSWEQIFVYEDSTSLDDRALMNEGVEAEEPDIVHTAIHHLIENFDLCYPMKPRRTSKAPSCYFSSQCGLDRKLPNRRESPSELESNSVLLQSFSSAAQQCFGRRDFAAAENYHKAYVKLQRLSRSAQSINDYSPILYSVHSEELRLIEDCEQRLEDKIPLIAHASDYRARLLHAIDDQIYRFSKIRLKEWYSCDIRKSKMWNQAWDVVKCLYKMHPAEILFEDGHTGANKMEPTNPFSLQSHRPNSLVRANSRDRRFPRFSREPKSSSAITNVFSGILAVDQGIFDALSSTVEHGGPNKLSAEESQQTLNWMRELDIHNFCLGEERLHRLCHEVDDLTRRILKTSTTSLGAIEGDEAIASALWKFDLFAYECKILNIKRVKHDNTQHEPNVSVTSQEEPASGISGMLLRRGSAGDLLSLGRSTARARGNSVDSLDNLRRRSRTVSSTSVAETITDFAYPTSPATTVGETGSHRLHRQSSALSATPSSNTGDEYDEQAVRDFLLQTQLGLTALLVSDFAETLFSRGCETDDWCNDDLPDTSAANKVDHNVVVSEPQKDNKPFDMAQLALKASDPQLPTPNPRLSVHHRTKSTNLSLFFSSSTTNIDSYKAALAPPSIDVGSPTSSSGVLMERTSSNDSYLDNFGGSDVSVTPVTPARSMSGRAARLQQFPLRKAYKEILQRFSVHPSPYEKLRALYEFELLIVSNLSSTDPHIQASLPRFAPVMPQSPNLTMNKSNSTISPASLRQHSRKDSEDLARLRLEKLAVAAIPSEHDPVTPTALDSNSRSPPGTDTIIEEMQRVFRDSDLRPKTLFRDLQYIASFIPAHILNMTDEGKVFWDVGLAALGFKREALESMTDFAAHILKSDESNHRYPDIGNNASVDAAKIYTICAREGEVSGMRELAKLQCNKPQLVSTTIPPFSNPSEIFSKLPTGKKSNAIVCGTTYSDMAKLEAAKVWFELAAAEGDEESRTMLTNLKNGARS